MQRCVFKVFKTFLALTLLKSFKLGLFDMKFGKQYFLVNIIVLKWLELKTLVMCLKLRVKLVYKVCYVFLPLHRLTSSNLVCLALNLAHNTNEYILFF